MSPPTLTSVHLNHLIQENRNYYLTLRKSQNFSHLYWGVRPLHKEERILGLKLNKRGLTPKLITY